MNHLRGALAQIEGGDIVDGLAGVIRAVGSEGFADAFCALLTEQFGVQDLIVLQRGQARQPLTVRLRRNRAAGPDQEARARGGSLPQIDPILRELIDDSPVGTYVLRTDASTGSTGSAWRELRRAQTEKLILARKSETDLTVLCVSGAATPLSRDLGQMGRVLLPLLDLHFRLVGGADTDPRLSVAEMEERVAATFPTLTRREVAVCARTILGVTAEGIALDLGIGQSSVLTYRRRAYARLNINSINQLSTMLIQTAGRFSAVA